MTGSMLIDLPCMIYRVYKLFKHSQHYIHVYGNIKQFSIINPRYPLKSYDFVVQKMVYALKNQTCSWGKVQSSGLQHKAYFLIQLNADFLYPFACW